jgi:phosphatidylglycerol:prolipoprotein diacylglycerol transferase
MYPYLRLGPFLLQLSGLALLLGVWVALALSEREARRLSLKPDLLYNLVFYGLVAGIVGARLAYAVRYLNAYLENPASLFALNANTLSVMDGFLIGLLAAFVYGQRKNLPLRPALDALAPGLATFMVFLGISHFLNGEAFGAPIRLPWSIYLWNEYRHPTQVYETLAALGILLVVLRRPLGQSARGLNFLLLVALSASARLLLETFRGDSLTWPGGFRAAQAAGVVILMASLWLARIWAQPTHPGENQVEPEFTQ